MIAAEPLVRNALSSSPLFRALAARLVETATKAAALDVVMKHASITDG